MSHNGRGWSVCEGGAEAGGGKLQNWSGNVLGGLEKRLKKARKEVERWRRMPVSKEKVAGEEVARYRVERMEEQLNTYYKQHAHMTWLRKGDRNTSFFHASVKERRRTNRIGKLRREDGSWAVKEEEKKEVVTKYFAQLFRS